MFRFLSKEISNLSVLDLCCGEGELQRWISSNSYQGIDKNSLFVRGLRAKGLSVMEGDILDTAWPAADCTVMVDGLYHFLPDLDSLLKKMTARQTRKIIISEPVRNFSSSELSIISSMATWIARVDGRSYPIRFSEDTFRAALSKYGFNRFENYGWNMIGIRENNG